MMSKDSKMMVVNFVSYNENNEIVAQLVVQCMMEYLQQLLLR